MSRVLAIVGPTASGKSALALALAEATGGEIVNADALQVYRGFDIGTAKPTPAERLRVPHHLVDILDPSERYSAGEFARRARMALASIASRGRTAILVGGSGLYLRTRPTPEHPEGQLVRGTAPAGCIVSQVGQQLEILTGGTFLATPHVITAPHTPGWSRLSAAHFVHLHSHQLLFPLPKFRSDATIRAYSPPVLAGTYGIKTLVDIGLAPASALDKLGYRHYDRLQAIHRQERGA